MDDQGLVERILQGDEAAFAVVFARHKAAVYRYAFHMRGRDAGRADDVVQEVFLAFLRQAAQFDASRGSIAAYLLGIARRQVCRDIERTRTDYPLDALDDSTLIAAPETDPLAGLTRAETVQLVRAAIRMLPPIFREVVVLCELNDLDYASAAAVIGCPLGTVRSRLARARALLLKTLDQTWKKTSIA